MNGRCVSVATELAVTTVIQVATTRCVAFLSRSFSFSRCSALEGLSVRQVVTVTWDPQPRVPVSKGVAPSGGCAQIKDLEQKGKMVRIAREPFVELS
ncbi:hypothetical protein Taro_037767 [Colocasia esculenta]|uniref:Uncharacterized protein n=1 Tax=Colocasia esculenta TaxID=4460 RepID=A0A843WH80_COLES|nr:hypothetical protein [Colocasia esculenta]